MQAQGQGGWPPPGGGGGGGGWQGPPGGQPPGGFGAPPGGAPPGGYGAPPPGGQPPGGFGAPPPGPQGYGPPGQPVGGAPPAAAPAPKKSRKGLILGCCGGCLVLFLGCAGSGGYLAWLEEGQDRYKPGEELASQPLSPAVTISAPATGSGYRRYVMWLAFDADLPAGREFQTVEVRNARRRIGTYATEPIGGAACRSYGLPTYLTPVSETVSEYRRYAVQNYDKTGTHLRAWVRLGDEYTRSGSTITCRADGVGVYVGFGDDAVPLSLTNPRVVITSQPQRPSDWF